MEEILKIICDYSLNRQFADEKFILYVFNFLVKKYNLFSYAKNIKIENLSYDNSLGEYFFNEKMVYIYINSLISNISKSHLKCNLDRYEYYFNVNLNVVRVIFHELNHALQFKRMNSNINNEERILCEICLRNTDDMVNNSSLDIKDKNIEKRLMAIHESLYMFNSFERMAEFDTIDTIYKMIEPEKLIPKKNKLIFYLYRLQFILKGHNNNYYSPTIKYLNEMGYNKDLENLGFNSESIDNVFLKYNFNERIYYGFPITEKEYMRVKNYKDNIFRQIKKQ